MLLPQQIWLLEALRSHQGSDGPQREAGEESAEDEGDAGEGPQAAPTLGPRRVSQELVDNWFIVEDRKNWAA